MNIKYIINSVDGVHKPIIEYYLMGKRHIELLFEEDKYVVNFKQQVNDVCYDYRFSVTLINNDNILKIIKELKNKIEEYVNVRVKLLDEDIENIELNEAEEEVSIDFYIDIKSNEQQSLQKENEQLKKQVAEYDMILQQHNFAEREGFR